MSRCGYPLSCEFWPGNTSDQKTVGRIIQIMKKRFSLERVIFVADRGMVSETNIKDIENNGLDYILGVRMRQAKHIGNKLIFDESPFEVVKENLHVKEVKVGEDRFIICFNPEQAEKDQRTRETILSKLKEKLQKEPKQLVGNRGYARFLKIDKDALVIDLEKVEQDSIFDGKYILTTNTELSAKDIALSLVLMTAIERKLEKKGIKLVWDDFIRDLRAFRAIRVKFTGKTYQLRTECRGNVAFTFQALGLRIPPVTQSV